MTRLLYAFAVSAVLCASAYAADREPPPNVERCDSIEQLEESYPKSVFTKLSPSEATAWLNKYPDPANEAVVFYSVPFPKDPHYVVVHAYTIKGCWVGAAQMPADKFYAVINGGSI